MGNASGFTSVFAGLAGALATAAGVGQTQEGQTALANNPEAIASVARSVLQEHQRQL